MSIKLNFFNKRRSWRNETILALIFLSYLFGVLVGLWINYVLMEIGLI